MKSISGHDHILTLSPGQISQELVKQCIGKQLSVYLSAILVSENKKRSPIRKYETRPYKTFNRIPTASYRHHQLPHLCAKRSNFFSTWRSKPREVPLQCVPSQISASNGPVTFLHQKEYLITVERNICRKGGREEEKLCTII